MLRLPMWRVPVPVLRLPQPPRFEPVINPTILTLGIVGLIVLGGMALAIFGLNLP